MALIKCEECGREVSDKAASCPGCGAPIATVQVGQAPSFEQGAASVEPRRGATWKFYIGMLLAIAGVLLLFVLLQVFDVPDSPEAIAAKAQRDERFNAKDAIAYCDDKYKEMNADRQYTQDMLRFQSGVCQHMRDEYRKKWGSAP